MAGQIQASFFLVLFYLQFQSCVQDDFLGVTVGMIVTVGFYNYGWWTGSAASHTKTIARNKGDMDEYEKHRIKAPKLLFI
jgi:hypothetical protein